MSICRGAVLRHHKSRISSVDSWSTTSQLSCDLYQLGSDSFICLSRTIHCFEGASCCHRLLRRSDGGRLSPSCQLGSDSFICLLCANHTFEGPSCCHRRPRRSGSGRLDYAAHCHLRLLRNQDVSHFKAPMQANALRQESSLCRCCPGCPLWLRWA